MEKCKAGSNKEKWQFGLMTQCEIQRAFLKSSLIRKVLQEEKTHKQQHIQKQIIDRDLCARLPQNWAALQKSGFKKTGKAAPYSVRQASIQQPCLQLSL